MPRSVTGTYTLAPGVNPVVGGTVITDTWANNTLNDVATAMTDSLSRSGSGAMTAPLRLPDGTLPLPALTFSNETTMGMWRSAPGAFSMGVGGVAALTVTSANVQALIPVIGLTAAAGTDTTQFATTAFVQHPDSPAMTGTPTAPTAAPGTNTTQVATTEFVLSTAFSLTIPGHIPFNVSVYNTSLFGGIVQ